MISSISMFQQFLSNSLLQISQANHCVFSVYLAYFLVAFWNLLPRILAEGTGHRAPGPLPQSSSLVATQTAEFPSGPLALLWSFSYSGTPRSIRVPSHLPQASRTVSWQGFLLLNLFSQPVIELCAMPASDISSIF